jgi:hypothetical protein
MNIPEQSSSTSLLRGRDTQSELDPLRYRYQVLGRRLRAVLKATAGHDRTRGEDAMIDALLLEMQRIRAALVSAGR